MAPGSSDPFADLTREHMQLQMHVDVLEQRIKRLRVKLEHQGKHINRVENSRRDLKKMNKELRESLIGYQEIYGIDYTLFKRVKSG
ncbi:hypothetical protein LCGC14_0593370 [marine sediment metagenome]|uniref:Uncharacterized protein n=1 Tax=marine sediment metagenome TaxID=412755 RepID=A0A0F9RHV4_9ZZZZ